jgi:hypothetical protein
MIITNEDYGSVVCKTLPFIFSKWADDVESAVSRILYLEEKKNAKNVKLTLM